MRRGLLRDTGGFPLHTREAHACYALSSAAIVSFAVIYSPCTWLLLTFASENEPRIEPARRSHFWHLSTLTWSGASPNVSLRQARRLISLKRNDRDNPRTPNAIAGTSPCCARRTSFHDQLRYQRRPRLSPTTWVFKPPGYSNPQTNFKKTKQRSQRPHAAANAMMSLERKI